MTPSARHIVVRSSTRPPVRRAWWPVLIAAGVLLAIKSGLVTAILF
ncbi:MAG: hypothetical protein AB7K09_10460 [Planctomycetota bacterium]